MNNINQQIRCKLFSLKVSNISDDQFIVRIKELMILEISRDIGIRPGGYGLAMTRSLVDELIYNEARNEVICIKYLD